MNNKDSIRILLKFIISSIFLLSGVCKVSPYIHPDTYIFMENSFRSLYVPLWQKILFDHIGHKASPMAFKFFIGNVELAAALLLWGTGYMPVFASIISIVVLTGACITHVMLGEAFTFPLVLAIASVLILFLSLKNAAANKKFTKSTVSSKGHNRDPRNISEMRTSTSGVGRFPDDTSTSRRRSSGVRNH